MLNEVKKKVHTCQTGLRGLLILKKLLEAPADKKSLIEYISKEVPYEPIKKDTITNDITTLRFAGLNIGLPSKDSANKYILKKHFLGLTFSEKDLNDLMELKKILYKVCDWRFIVEVYKLFLSLSTCATKHIVGSFLDFGYFNSIDLEILESLDLCAKQKSQVSFIYDVKSSGLREMTIIANKIKYTNEKLYIWGYNENCSNELYLRIDRIKEITNVALGSKKNKIKFPKGKYRIRGESAMNFVPDDDEKIIEAGEGFVVVESPITNEFYFIQKILNYGLDCKLLAPYALQGKVLKLLYEIYSRES